MPAAIAQEPADLNEPASTGEGEPTVEQPLGDPNEVMLNMSSRYFTASKFDIEVAGFRLMRRDVVSSTIGLPDLDIALASNGERLLPLARMLYAFGIKITGDRYSLAFNAEFAPAVKIDLQEKTIAYDGAIEPFTYLAGISEITNNREIYVTEAALSRIFNLELSWEDDLYEYVAVTDELLKMWRGRGKAYTGHEAELVKEALPELYGPATPNNNSLDFVQTRVAVDISARENDDTRVSINTAEDFWGGLWGGRYQLRFQQPDISWEDGQGFDSGEQNLSVPRYASWARIFDKNEVTVGDSNFSVNELALPFIDFTGARVNGVLGSGSSEINELTSFNIDGSFVQTRRFEGEAELGSSVKLFINDSEVAEAEVYEEPESPVGFGRYEFDEVSIPAGNLVAIRIEITEPGGRRVVRDLSTFNSNKLRPAGQLSYVGGIGTVRDETEWDNNGLIGAARFLYGINNRLTVGATIGHQNNAGSQFTDNLSVGSRARADQSDHLGLEFVVNPFSTLLLSTSLAQSDGSLEGSALVDEYKGSAFTVTADYVPNRRFNFSSRAYRYEPGFFNGVDVGLENREGYYAIAESHFNKFRATADYGKLQDNVDNDQPLTTSAEYYGLRLSSDSLLPYTYLFAEHDEVVPDDFASKSISSVGLRSNLLRFNIDASLTKGDLFDLDSQVRDLFQNIALPNVRITGSPSSSFAISRAMGAHRLALEFDGEGTDISQRTQLTHYWDSAKSPGQGFLGTGGLRVVTELSYNEQTKNESISNRLNWYLDSRRRNRVGMVSSYDSNSGWSWQLDFNLTNIFALRSGRLLSVSSATVNPSYGGISGMVFLDSNANGRRDSGEKGVTGIRVSSSDSPHGAFTDAYGEFYLSRRANQNESMVYVDIESVPATMIPVHAKQAAVLERGLTSRTEFALAPMVSLTGVLLSPERAEKNIPGETGVQPASEDAAQLGRKPMSGVRIELTDMQGKVVGESITATDGSYFFNAIPGKYQLWVDPQTVHPLLTFNEPAFTMQVAGVEEYQELEFEPIYAELLSPGGVDQPPAPELAPLSGAADTLTSETADEALQSAQESVPEPIETVPLDLTRPKINHALQQPPANGFSGVRHTVRGQFVGERSDQAGFSPIVNARILLTRANGEQVTAVTTDAEGYYTFEVPAGAYTITIDSATVPLQFVYDQPALTLKVISKETPQRIKLKTIYANYIELKN
ncbi:MAG: hypothetical protein HKO71_02930 [Pseudomonadales bacterium]|nr:carboxypeptidase regulatory-like domain-containing protein [Gammaproteobacteria bacterium]NNL56681.1 hypothetical protein [Pseudomonadales bacterium]